MTPRTWLDRRLPEEFVRELEPGGGLRCLVEFTFDRERSNTTGLVLAGESKHGRRSKVHIYSGTAGLLTIEWCGKAGVRFQARETKTFASLVFDPSWSEPRHPDELVDITPGLLDYLDAKWRLAQARYSREGLVQVAVMRGGPTWTALDREVVPSYLDKPTRSKLQDAYQVPLDHARAIVAAQHDWARKWKRKGNELDCLAIDDAGNLLVIEVKTGDANDLEQAPLQVAFYAQMITRCLSESPDTVVALRGLAAQRQRIGLCALVPRILDVPKVLPIVAVGNPVGARASKRWPVVLDAVRAAGRELAGLEVWRVEPEGSITRTGSESL